MKEVEVPSYPVQIFIAGDLSDAKRICRQHCFDVGLCVTVTETAFIYTGGEERGVCVGLINYPRFPITPADNFARAVALANALIVGLSQWSATVQAPDKTIWLTRRPEDAA